jgi:transposase
VSKKGVTSQAIGIGRGGRNTKIQAIADTQGKPLAFLPTHGQAAACGAAEAMLEGLRSGASSMPIAPMTPAYDTNRIRNPIKRQGQHQVHQATPCETVAGLGQVPLGR